jgi:hypothetical protein
MPASSLVLAALVLSLSPWRGPALPTAASAAAKYRLDVRGSAHQSVHLRVVNLPAGWMAAFCTPRFCSPLRYTMTLGGLGRGSMEFEAIRLDPHAGKRVHLTVAGGTARAGVDVAAH